MECLPSQGPHQVGCVLGVETETPGGSDRTEVQERFHARRLL